ncbi:MAG: hypothetical protein QOH67_4124 [Hyphomicrobiales bacterium]|jgi:hypothetical protein|nr:hypothetical protein [Hyphomicrobiales bacterium]
MKTTELYLEQVLIGFLIIAIGALPWLPELWRSLEDIKAVVGIVGGSAALGLAFLIGIPFDRLADTLLDRLDARSRIELALGKLKGRYKSQKEWDESLPFPDLYPEDRLLIAGRRRAGPIVDSLDYHRSRIRLARALAVFGPALTFIATLAVARWEEAEIRFVQLSPSLWLGVVVAAYLVWMLLVVSDDKLPRTNEPRILDEGGKPAWRVELRSWIVPLLLLLASTAMGLAAICNYPDVLLTALGGAALTILCTWTWWRITSTYRLFLLNCDRFSDKTGAP